VARERDEGKRKIILAEAKRLFAARGFHATSVQDIVKGIDIPVGSVYTYFENKDDIIRCAIDEGWAEFYRSLEDALAAEPSPSMRMSLVVYGFLPRLFKDVELISLFLSEGLRFTDLNAKLESLARLIGAVVNDLGKERGMAVSLSPKQAVSALSIFFLGSLDTIRLSRLTGIPISERDVISFISLIIEASFGIRLPELPAAPSL
jgi:AcrR family transcriptional regulator